jgi:hypothetical protein
MSFIRALVTFHEDAEIGNYVCLKRKAGELRSFSIKSNSWHHQYPKFSHTALHSPLLKALRVRGSVSINRYSMRFLSSKCTSAESITGVVSRNRRMVWAAIWLPSHYGGESCNWSLGISLFPSALHPLLSLVDTNSPLPYRCKIDERLCFSINACYTVTEHRNFGSADLMSRSSIFSQDDGGVMGDEAERLNPRSRDMR